MEQIEALAGRAYGADIDAAKLTAGLGVVARALNAGDAARAMTAAVLLKLPDLDWAGAVRIAQAEDMLLKYSEDQPRDWHGRWTDGDDQGPAVTDLPVSLSEPSLPPLTQIGANDDPNSPADTPAQFSLPADWLHLPPGERIDELGDLAEWIANAKPEDEAAIRADIKRIFYDVGDGQGGDGISAFLDDALKRGTTLEDRQNILDALDSFTRTDPAEAARFTGLINTLIASGTAFVELPAAIAGAIGSLGETAAVASDVWKLGWAARGVAIERALGANLVSNFPVIDIFLDGIATSIKSLDLNAGVYQDAARLTSRVNAYVDKIASFNEVRWGTVEILPNEITGRTLNLAIPKASGSAVQRAALKSAQERAKGLGVDLIITPF
jgi:hypothetical protein